MNGKSARVLVTLKCNRHCAGCCNDNLVCQYETLSSAQKLMDYDNIVITGGEPVLVSSEVTDFIDSMKIEGYKGKFYMYCATYAYRIPFNDLDGITFTLHHPCKDSDVEDLVKLSKELISISKNCYRHKPNARLVVDKRVYEDYDFSNVDLSGWDVIRKLQWKEECPIAPNEDLFYLPLD